MEIRPQPAQEKFLANPSDIVIFGGSAGGGKTFSLLLDPLRDIGNPHFGAVLFRRTSPEITNEGGMWDESGKIYPHCGATPKVGTLDWRFPSGANIGFRHLQSEDDKYAWQGAQVPMIGFDQLEHFEEGQFWYLLSRNRSTCGVPPRIRATCNPKHGWLADLIAWWIDPDTGFPITERSGVIRWFVRIDNRLQWADLPEELHERFPGPDTIPKSMTFIPAKLTDNPALLKADPGYLANLLALPHIEKERLLSGNWKITNEGGEWPPDYFPASIWFDEWPRDMTLKVMFLDPSKGRSDKSGDYSAFVMIGLTPDGTLWVDADVKRGRDSTRIVQDGIELYRQFSPDGFGVETNQFQELLATELVAESKRQGVMIPIFYANNNVNKEVRIRRIGPYLAHHNLRFRSHSPGAALLVQQLQDFPQGKHDDGPDALDGAIRLAKQLHNGRIRGGMIRDEPTIIAA